jgi:hypothetical protein
VGDPSSDGTSPRSVHSDVTAIPWVSQGFTALQPYRDGVPDKTGDHLKRVPHLTDRVSNINT